MPARLCRGSLAGTASALIGNARWAQATPGWAERPHLWLGVVGDSGSGKSPARLPDAARFCPRSSGVCAATSPTGVLTELKRYLAIIRFSSESQSLLSSVVIGLQRESDPSTCDSVIAV